LEPFAQATATAKGEPLKTESVDPSTQGLTISTLFTERTDMIISRYKAEVALTAAKVKQHSVELKKKQIKVVKTEARAVAQTKVNKQGRARYFELTAYTAGFESTGKHKGDKGYGVTSSGTTVKEGRTAACPVSMKSGTKLYIPSLNKTLTCEDTGSAITEGHIDVYIADLDEALDFGRKHDVKVYVLRET
jgi:3D (Asp-Asp-Asp) domain-containing protein